MNYRICLHFAPMYFKLNMRVKNIDLGTYYIGKAEL